MMLENVSFLYVEDDPRSCQVMELIMKNVMGVKHLAIFNDSSNFLSRLKTIEPQPSVILLDVNIKPHDGFEMLNMIRADSEIKPTKVIALTASVMNEEVERLRTMGFDGAISKPLSVSVFPGLIELIVHGESVWYIA